MLGRESLIKYQKMLFVNENIVFVDCDIDRRIFNLQFIFGCFRPHPILSHSLLTSVLEVVMME